MDSQQRRRVTRAVRQNLETDALLGLSEVPIPKHAVQSLRNSNRSPSPKPVGKMPPAKAPSIVGPDNQAKAERLKALAEQYVDGCEKCHLAQSRNKVVFGQGAADTNLVFVGEAPGAEEDRQGLAFVGRAGQLLTRMVEAMGLTRDQVYICNVLKCRPPGNRTPSADEIAACSPILTQQLQIIEPKVIVALGAPASQTLLETKESIGRLRGSFHDFYPSGTPLVGEPVKLMPTYHPAYLLRNPADKRKAWEDLQLVMVELGLPLP
ncbi:MAG TPA: uracil-DNA glycosylase [Phycisphaerae bacterium]|nr:uracil-DNA glycosylase [Phycisphaerae bacterium]